MIKYLSLFSGIGAFESAMKNLNIPVDLVGFSEIDKYAVKSYCAIQNVSESSNLGDITKIDDFITYGFPCQDISLAGKQQGLFNEDGSKTRSGLFFDALRIIEHTQPMVAIAENVKNLTGKKFAEQFKIVLESLESAGYNNYWKVLNAKDYGIPQNRERVFIISIRKDVDTGIFEFPEPYPLKLRLKDVLEDAVDEKFYLSDVQIEKLCLKSADALIYDKSMIGFESNATDTDKVMQIGNCRPTKNRANPNQGRIYDIDGISPCINTKGGGNLEPHIIDKPKVIGGIGEKKSNGGQQWYQQDRVYDGDDVAVSVTTGFNPYYAVAEPAIVEDFYKNRDERIYTDVAPALRSERTGLKVKEPYNLCIRKLTPKECFRLMGFDDESFHKAEAVCSNTQLYKQAGNSIVVDVAEELLCMLFDEDGNFFV